MKPRVAIPLYLLALAFAAAAGVLSVVSQCEGQPPLSAEAAALVEEHVFGGLPSADPVVVRQGYVLAYDGERRVPRWVAYRITLEYRNLPPRQGRFARFRDDPDLSTDPSDDDYNGLFASRGYARGHLAPYAVMGGDRNNDGATAEADEFDALTIFQSNYMSNISPQHHVAFNGSGGLWFKLERWVQDDVVLERGLEVWEIAGCVFGQGSPEKVGPAADILVPPMFFKLVIRQEPDIPDAPRVLAFLMPHQRARHGEIEDFLVSVDVVEALTGLDFFKDLDDDLEAAIEDRDTFESWAGF